MQFDPDVIEQARQIDLLSYLQWYEPSNLKRVAGNVYCTREHDSLKISNGKWYWWSRGFGGYSALHYLMKVRELGFVEAAAPCREKGRAESAAHAREKYRLR